MKNNTSFGKLLAPIIVLVGICLVISAALAMTYGVANPRIVARAMEDANAARQRVLPSAETFSLYEGELWASEDGKVAVTEVQSADNASGIVVTVETTSFGGKLTEMVGISKDGKITGVEVTNHADTPGVGTKAMTEEHLGSYVGVDDLSDVSAKKMNMHVSGASVSSNGIHYGIYGALQQFEKMGGAN